MPIEEVIITCIQVSKIALLSYIIIFQIMSGIVSCEAFTENFQSKFSKN